MQSSFGDFADEEPEKDEIPDGTPHWLSDDAESGWNTCPWCLHPFDEDSEGVIACDDCGARIPTHMDWVQEGEKVVL